jgi:hypothetical protein
MTQRISREMLRSRLLWVADLSRLQLEIDHNANGYTLYQVDKLEQKRMYEIAYAENTRCMWNILKGMYELLTVMEGKK